MATKEISEILRDIETEKRLLGAAMLSPQGARFVARLPRELFTAPFAKKTHAMIASLISKGFPVSKDALLAEIAGDAPFEEWLHSCAELVDSPDYAEFWAGILADRAAIRIVQDALNKIAQKSGSVEDTIRDAMDRAHRVLTKSGNAGVLPLAEAAVNLGHDDDSPILSTGICEVDEIVRIRKGHLVYIAATPGMGKTSLAIQVAHRAAEDGLQVLLVSLEMSAEEIARRLASRCGISFVPDVRKLLDSLPIFYSTAHTPGGIRYDAREVNPDVIIIDYIGLMSHDIRGMDNRNLELTAISRDLKVLATTSECPVICLSQLNRKGASEAVPQLHHLRDSGALEADADAVFMLYQAEDGFHIKIAKHRHGPTGDFQVYFDAASCTMRTMR